MKGKTPLIVGIIVILVVAAGVTAYMSSSKFSTSGNPISSLSGALSGQKMATEADFAAIEDPLLRKHFAAQANARAYRVTSQSDGQGDEMSSIMEFSMNGSSFAYRMQQLLNANPQTDMIVIDDTTYVKDFKDGSWWMQKNQASDSSIDNDADAMAAPTPEPLAELYADKQAQEFRSLGEEACGSLTCHKYEEVYTDESQRRVFWFDTKSYLLRRDEVGFGEFTTVNTYVYENVSVQAPSSTKEVPAGKSIYEYMVFGDAGSSMSIPGMSGDEVNQMMEDAQNMDYDAMMEKYGDYAEEQM